MQKNVAKVLLVGFLAVAIGAAGFSGLAEAKSEKTKTKNKSVSTTVRVRTENQAKTKTKTAKNKKVKAKKRTIPGKMVGAPATLTQAEMDVLIGSSSEGATHKIIFKKGNTNYTAYISAATAIVDRKGGSLTLTNFADGQKISVRGSVVGNEIYKVMKLRNVTLPIGVAETEED